MLLWLFAEGGNRYVNERELSAFRGCAPPTVGRLGINNYYFFSDRPVACSRCINFPSPFVSLVDKPGGNFSHKDTQLLGRT